MPEGHTVHRVARQLTLDLVGRRVDVSSPQGRFAGGAALLDGLRVVASRAHGKHLFVGFGAARGADAPGEPAGGPPEDTHWTDAAEHWLRVHLGLYGAWDLHGAVTPLDAARPTGPTGTATSLGAPRRTSSANRSTGRVRSVRVGEEERPLAAPSSAPGPAPGGAVADGATADAFPPPPVGQVRVRLATDDVVADLRGPSACEVLTPAEVRGVLAAAGPDPAVDPDGAEELVRRVTRRRVAVGRLLMDQGVVAGIGNIYRAELLFRAALSPHSPGSGLPAEVVRALWADWADLLADGIATGVMLTRDDLDEEGRRRALHDRSMRHAVYGRAGEPCLRCGTPVVVEDMAGRNLFHCPGCQTR